MKLDYETLQFERQLKRAKRLSLLDYAANEERRRQEGEVIADNKQFSRSRNSSSTVSKNCVSHMGSIRNRSKKIKRCTSSTVNKLRCTAVRRVVQRHKMGPKVKRGASAVQQPPVKHSHVSYPESHQLIDLETCGQLPHVDIDAHLEVVSAASVGNKHSTTQDALAAEAFLNGTSHERKLPQPSFRLVNNYVAPPCLGQRSEGFYRFIEKTPDELDDEVEYDMDEEDLAWLKLLNEERRRLGKPNKFPPLSLDTFERLMDRFEKEAHQLGQDVIITGQQISNQDATSVPNDDDATCNICGDDECTNTNAILFCDACNLAVHQECYGVPYVPEGQWLCRRCQAGVSADVACCLCPVRGGAVKRTNDGRWAHVVCALWVPEVGFGSIELLEPITKLDQVPPARRRLTCAVCSQNNAGACVQCMRKHCYKAFHITCAQQVGLYMKIEPVFDASGMMVNVSKTLLCDTHKPPGARLFQPMIDNSVDNDGRPPAPEKVKSRPVPAVQGRCQNRSRKGSRDAVCKKSEERSSTPVRDVPVIPPKRLACIAESLSMRDKNQLITKLQAYWTLKRRARNGVPLLRRLQLGAVSTATASKSKESADGSKVMTDVMCIKRLRQQMEKVRLLLELIRKRERSKRELIKVQEAMLKLKLEPFAVHLHGIIDELQEQDMNGIFAHPVSAKDAPDYAARIKRPMDFSTMRMKVDRHAYRSFDEFEDDFWLIVNNCKAYNEDGSLYYNLAAELGSQGKAILEVARQSVYKAGYCPWTGLLYPTEEYEAKCKTASHFSSPSKIQARRCSEHVGKMRRSGLQECKIRRHSIAEVPENAASVGAIIHHSQLKKNGSLLKAKESRARATRRSFMHAEDLPSKMVSSRRHSTSTAFSADDNSKLRRQSDSEQPTEGIVKFSDIMERASTSPCKITETKHVVLSVLRKRKRRRKSAYPFPEKVRKVKRPQNAAAAVASPHKKGKEQQLELHEDVQSSHKPPLSCLPTPDSSPTVNEADSKSHSSHNTRSRLHSNDDTKEDLLEGIGHPTRKRRRTSVKSPTANEEDEPPQLSRCPSPLDDICSTEPFSPTCETASGQFVQAAATSADPPRLAALRACESETSASAAEQEKNDEHDSLERESDVTSAEYKANDKQICVRELTVDKGHIHRVPEGQQRLTELNNDSQSFSTLRTNDKSVKNSVAKSAAINSVGLTGLAVSVSNTTGVVPLEDTLDSVVSTESQTCAGNGGREREGLFDRFLPTSSVADCDSSYGSTYGRGGAATSDSDTTSSSPDRAGMSSSDSDGTSGSPGHQITLNVDAEGVADSIQNAVKTKLSVDNTSISPSFGNVSDGCNNLEKTSKLIELQNDQAC